MKIGFTGTRHGMTASQQRTFKNLFTEKIDEIKEFHHGDCVGSDENAHNIVDNIRKDDTKHKIAIHPPSYNKFRAHCKGDIVFKPLPYLKRNHNIVDATDRLVATPDTPEKLASGTWATIRYARKQGKDIYIIKRNGTVDHEKSRRKN